MVSKMVAVIIIKEAFSGKSGIQVLNINSVLCLKCLFLVLHIIVTCFGFSYDLTSYQQTKMMTKMAAVIAI